MPQKAAGWRIEPPVSVPSAGRDDGRRHQRGRAAGGPARRARARIALRLPRIDRRAEIRGCGGGTHGEFVEIGLGGKCRAGRDEIGSHRRLVRRDEALQHGRRGRGADSPSVQNRSLTATGTPSSGKRRLSRAARRRSAARAASSARSGIGVTTAFSASAPSSAASRSCDQLDGRELAACKAGADVGDRPRRCITPLPSARQRTRRQRRAHWRGYGPHSRRRPPCRLRQGRRWPPTEVIGATSSVSTSFRVSTQPRIAPSSAARVSCLLLGDLDTRERGDALDGRAVQRHRRRSPSFPEIPARTDTPSACGLQGGRRTGHGALHDIS